MIPQWLCRSVMGFLLFGGSLTPTLGWAQTGDTIPTPPVSGQGTMVDGAGFTLHDVESIKGSDEKKIEADPVCDRSKRPRITKVVPDDVKPGDKVVITGENFGTKECFHTVTFSSAAKTMVVWTFVNDTTIEATVPESRAGMSFIVIVAGGGSAQSKPVLIQK